MMEYSNGEIPGVETQMVDVVFASALLYLPILLKLRRGKGETSELDEFLAGIFLWCAR